MLKHMVIMFTIGTGVIVPAHVNANLLSVRSFDELVAVVGLENKVVGTRLQDLVETNSNFIPGAANLAVAFSKNPERFFNQEKIEVLHDVFFEKLPENNAGIIHLELVGFVKYKNNQLNFEKITVEYAPGAKKAEDFSVTTTQIIPLSQMNFKADVGLVDRKLILSDDSKNIKLVFPIGVGSFDEGVMNEGRFSLVTPRFQRGFLDKHVVDSKRTKPRYFKGLPFIRLLKGPDYHTDETPIGFHIEINDSFVRGFDSHGCMRLREMDLMAFHDLIMFGNDRQIPLRVLYRLEDQSDSPIAKRNKIYKTIENKGSIESPFFILDKDTLVQMRYKEALPPMDKLLDDPKDHYEDVFSYDTDSQLKEQDQRRANECQQKVLSGEIAGDDKAIKACLDAGKRKDSMSDRIYRKFMGIDSIIPESSSLE